VLEFLPFAHFLFEVNQCEEWLTKSNDNPGPLCVFYKPVMGGSGHCSQYRYRGLICRLFGFSARTNKYSQREFITCQTIKTDQAAAFAVAVEKINHGEMIPVINHYYMRLIAIDRDPHAVMRALQG
jgi:Fe-S-cluster containining protein